MWDKLYEKGIILGASGIVNKTRIVGHFLKWKKTRNEWYFFSDIIIPRQSKAYVWKDCGTVGHFFVNGISVPSTLWEINDCNCGTVLRQKWISVDSGGSSSSYVL